MNRRPRPKSKKQPGGPTGRTEPERGPERLQKVLAAAGVGSRRECEELIREGRVEVDRQVVTDLGIKVDPARQLVRVDGVELTQPKLVYYAVNKPPGVVCTNRDPAGRIRVVDLIKTEERLFTVGRLDRTSEGLILVTNDGQLTNRLAHPRYGVPKTYRVHVVGHPTREQLNLLRQGIRLAEGVAKVASVRVKRRTKRQTELEIVLTEGRNREIRRLLARINHKVVRLQRIAIGDLRLQGLPLGAYRKLTREEIAMLTSGQRSRAWRFASPKKKRSGPKPAGQGRGAPRSRKPAVKTTASRTTGTILDFDDVAETPSRKKKTARTKAPSRRTSVSKGKTGGGKVNKKRSSRTQPAKAKAAKAAGKGKSRRGR